jgi:signal transduction histidine kinase
LTKPFASTELMVRCRNLLASHQLQQQFVQQAKDLELSLEQIKESETQLVHQAKMASLGQLSAGLMHEINNPLNFTNTALHLVKKRLKQLSTEDQARIEKPLQDMQEGVQRVSTIISSLRSFTHPDVASFSSFPLINAVGDAARFVQTNAVDVSLEFNIEESLTVWGNQNQLIHLFINLFQNAVDSLHEKDLARREVRASARRQADEVRVEVFDNGQGISVENQARIFDAFFTTKAVGSGVGLGLNICHRIVKQHRGRIELESTLGEYCRFIIYLPTTPTPPNS